ncbi:MAG: DAK2 domain-containing protein [Anaerolineae bacterium]|nr:DAK2 domain-containing protein [Anaerolineae bacterium]
MSVPEGDVIRALDGHRLKLMILAALSWLRQHQEQINALNVFPVPDGDTGTNMMLTMASVWDEIADMEEAHVGKLMSRLAHGALMGARGNSGVILSQIWRGFAHGQDGHATLTAESIAVAMRVAAETAYKGVVKPVEGTILTVVRDVSEETAIAAEETDDIVEIFERMVASAKASVARTPSLLPVLRQAGVVDAGGQGLYVIFEGMLRDLKGLPVADLMAHEGDLSHLHLDAHPEGDEALEFDSDYPYDVQFIVMGKDIDVAKMRAGIEAMGDCPLTVGDELVVKVHVHVADPGKPITLGAQFGSISDVVVEDMQAQFEAYSASRAASPIAEPTLRMPVGLLASETPPAISVVVVAAGEGLINVFRSLGATAVVEGGQTMNPSTAQILDAVEQTASDDVIILPNNKNILMSAQQVVGVSDKHVRVVSTHSIPQGVSALLALDQSVSLEANAEAMKESSLDVITGEITWATREVRLNGIDVHEGDAIGLLEDELVVDAKSFDEAVHWLLAEADLDGRELVTLYYGEQVVESQAQDLASNLAEAYADLEFEVVTGGQPHYPYIISIE